MPTKLRPNANETASPAVCPRPCNVMLANQEATYLSDATVAVNGGKLVTSSRPYLIRASFRTKSPILSRALSCKVVRCEPLREPG